MAAVISGSLWPKDQRAVTDGVVDQLVAVDIPFVGAIGPVDVGRKWLDVPTVVGDTANDGLPRSLEQALRSGKFLLVPGSSMVELFVPIAMNETLPARFGSMLGVWLIRWTRCAEIIDASLTALYDQKANRAKKPKPCPWHAAENENRFLNRCRIVQLQGLIWSILWKFRAAAVTG